MSRENSETQLQLSVVIASWSGREALTRCLESLLPQVEMAEVIVAFRGVSDLMATVGSRFANVRFLRGPADASVFLLRSLGVHEARGQLIAMLEDHAAVSVGWAKAMLDAYAAGKKIFGGPIENDAKSSAYDWALYFAEYGIYMPPLPAGQRSILSGVNIAYDHATLQSCRGVWESVFYETDVNAMLISAGHKLYMVPEASVTSRLRMPMREAMVHLFGGGVHFAEFRKRQSGAVARRLWVIAAPAVPLVLLLRIIRLTMGRQPARIIQIIRALPYLLLLVGAWAAGEARSYAYSATAHGLSERINHE